MQSLNVPYVDVETGAAQFDVAGDGTLVYAPGGVVPDVMRRLVRVDRSGRVEPLAAPAKAGYAVLQLSPDDRRIAVTAREGLTWSLWVYDLERGTMTRPAPSPEGAMLWPRWRPDGGRLAFSWSRRDETDIHVADADGSGAPDAITHTRTMKSPSDWAPDGRSLLYAEGGDIALLARDGSGWTSRPLLASPASETSASVSPDGRWMAYASDETGRDEVYLQRFPELGAKVQVSTSGGYSPVWSRDGRELFYAREHEGAYTGDLWAVAVGPAPTPRLGTPRELFDLDERRLWNSALVSGFDVAGTAASTSRRRSRARPRRSRGSCTWCRTGRRSCGGACRRADREPRLRRAHARARPVARSVTSRRGDLAVEQEALLLLLGGVHRRVGILEQVLPRIVHPRDRARSRCWVSP